MSGNVSPQAVGSQIFILPAGSDEDVKGRFPVYLRPGRAFGSGEHETTRHCLEILQTLDLEGHKVLDVGAGTGILSIAAVRLGVARVVALDIDPDAILTTRDNVKANGMESKIFPFLGVIDALSPGRFNLVIANLYGDLIAKLAKTLLTCLTDGGICLLSGISYDNAYDVKARLGKGGGRILQIWALDEYVTVLATAGSAPY